MFLKSADLYDLFYTWKDYPAEVQRIHEIVRAEKQSEGNTLLDIACGSGHHIEYLKRLYQTEGLDLDQGLLQAARERNPEVTFHLGDMRTFDLGKKFDVVLCLFSSIGYTKTVANMEQAITQMANHLKPGGILVLEPWFTKETYSPGLPFALNVDKPELKATRMNVSRIEGDVSVLDFHYLLATPEGVEYFTERHELGLFSQDEHIQAFRKSGLQVRYDGDGLMGRGLYIGVREPREAA